MYRIERKGLKEKLRAPWLHHSRAHKVGGEKGGKGETQKVTAWQSIKKKLKNHQKSKRKRTPRARCQASNHFLIVCFRSSSCVFAPYFIKDSNRHRLSGPDIGRCSCSYKVSPRHFPSRSHRQQKTRFPVYSHQRP